jgi:hypothetical protein
MASVIQTAPAREILAANGIEEVRFLGQALFEVFGESGKRSFTVTCSCQWEWISEAGCAVDLDRIGRHAPSLRSLQLYTDRHW